MAKVWNCGIVNYNILLLVCDCLCKTKKNLKPTVTDSKCEKNDFVTSNWLWMQTSSKKAEGDITLITSQFAKQNRFNIRLGILHWHIVCFPCLVLLQPQSSNFELLSIQVKRHIDICHAVVYVYGACWVYSAIDHLGNYKRNLQSILELDRKSERKLRAQDRDSS